MFNKIRVKCWLSYSLPVLSPKPWCQAPDHATLCFLHLADGMSRQCTGTSLCSLSLCHQCGSRWHWCASLLPCPPPPCSAAPQAHDKLPMTFSSFFLTPAAGRHDWVELWVLQVTTTAWRMGFSHSMSWQSDSQSREWAALILLLFIPPKHSSISKGVLWCFRWAQKSEAAMSCRYLWQSFTGGVALIQSIR